MKTVKVLDKEFSLYIPQEKIENAIQAVADQVNIDLADKNPLFLVVLNGAFMFASELFKRLTIPCEISFVKLSSYAGTETTNVVRELIGLDHSLDGRHVVVVEDIVDTGHTMRYTLQKLRDLKAVDVRIATLFFKPANFQYDYPIDYKGMDIGNEFIVGYGLDYDQQGRNLPDIYKVIDNTKNTTSAMRNIILFGPPGAGKGTQSQFLREKYQLTYISTGEILREEIAAETELGLQVKGIISQGGLVSDEIVAAIIEKKLSENLSSPGFLFDGYPRTVKQAEILDEMMQKYGIALSGVLSLVVPENLLIERMLERGKISGRADDNIDSIKHRFVEYEAKTKPVLDYYQGSGKLYAVNGVGEIPQIFKNLCEVIDTL